MQVVHHRVKNNLQVLSSLMSLQAHAVDDPAVMATLLDTMHRIQSMALVHQHLYQGVRMSQEGRARTLKR